MEVSVTPSLQFILWLELIKESVGSINTPVSQSNVLSVLLKSRIVFAVRTVVKGMSRKLSRKSQSVEELESRTQQCRHRKCKGERPGLESQPLLGL